MEDDDISSSSSSTRTPPSSSSSSSISLSELTSNTSEITDSLSETSELSHHHSKNSIHSSSGGDNNPSPYKPPLSASAIQKIIQRQDHILSTTEASNGISMSSSSIISTITNVAASLTFSEGDTNVNNQQQQQPQPRSNSLGSSSSSSLSNSTTTTNTTTSTTTFTTTTTGRKSSSGSNGSGGGGGNNNNNSLTASRNGNENEQSVMIRVKLPESHPLITKVLRLPLNSTIKECIFKIHQIVTLSNYKDCIIVHNQSVLPENSLLSNYFGSGDDSIVHTIEIKEIKNNNSNSNNNNNNTSNNNSLTSSNSNNTTSSSSSSSSTTRGRPMLSHSNSVQSLLSMGVPKKKLTTTSGGGGSNSKDPLIFQAPPPSYTKDLENLLWLTSPNHQHKSIPCLYHKWRSRDSSESKITILYSAGNFEDIGITKKLMRVLSETLQCNIFSYDYTGFGLNTSGSATIKELCEDIQIVFNHLVNTLKIPSKQIILMGKSIGTIATLKFASTLFPKSQSKTSTTSQVLKTMASLKSPPTSPSIEQCKQYKSVGGLILLNSFGPGGLSENIVNMILSVDAFDHLKKIDRISCPVLLIHGEEDQIVNIKASKKLTKIFSANLYRFIKVKDAGHFNIDTLYMDDYEDHLIDFVKYISPESFQRKERELPLQYSMSPNKVVGAWLERLGLSEYSQNFLQYGYFDLSSISTLDQSMLEMMGIKDESHLSILLSDIEKMLLEFYGGSSSTSTSILVNNLLVNSINNSIDGSNNNGSKRNSSNSTSSNISINNSVVKDINQHIKSLSTPSSTRNSQNLTSTTTTTTPTSTTGESPSIDFTNSISTAINSNSSISSSCSCSPDNDCTCSEKSISNSSSRTTSMSTNL